jgi:hypothetical protein
MVETRKRKSSKEEIADEPSAAEKASPGAAKKKASPKTVKKASPAAAKAASPVIDLDDEDNDGQWGTPKMPGTPDNPMDVDDAPVTPLATKTRASTAAPTNQLNRTVFFEQSFSTYGNRKIPWKYEGDAWRLWPDQHSITFKDQKFRVSGNHAPTDESGDCLFRALSSIFTGSPKNHLYFRAEHYKFWLAFDLTIEEVKGAREKNQVTNKQYLEKLDKLPRDGTMKSRLKKARAWQNIEILELTSLIYRVQVIVFDDSAPPRTAAEAKRPLQNSPENRPPKDVQFRSFGPRNRTQIFLRFTGPNGGNHFQPMFPEVQRPEEYRCTLLDGIEPTSAQRHWQWRSSSGRRGAASEVPQPFLWRLPPPLKINDVAMLRGTEVRARSEWFVEQKP